MGGQHDGLFLYGSPPILYIYTLFFSWQINSAAAAATAAGDIVFGHQCL